jgi:hypothetical protein
MAVQTKLSGVGGGHEPLEMVSFHSTETKEMPFVNYIIRVYVDRNKKIVEKVGPADKKDLPLSTSLGQF